MNSATPQSRTSPRPSTTYSRRFGRNYYGLDDAAAASICFQDIGKVQVDCKLCVRQTQWGQLGSPVSPAAIIYMDFSFHQPPSCRLANATVLVTLEPIPASEGVQDGEEVRSNSTLQMTDYYGPRHLSGEATSVAVTKTVHLTPQLNILGGGASGMGVEHQQALSYNTRWSFTGQLLARQEIATTRSAYRTLKWELCENELGGRASHSNVIHTGFTMEHTDSPFLMRIDIHGKLQRKRDRVRKGLRHLKFPSPHDRDQGMGETLVSPSTSPGPRKTLDGLALGLSSDMERRNLLRIPVHVPDSLAVSFTADNEAGLKHEEPPVNTSANPDENLIRPMGLAPNFQPGNTLTAPEDTNTITATTPGSAISNLSSAATAVDAARGLQGGRSPAKHMAMLDNAVQSFHRAQRGRAETKPPPSAVPVEDIGKEVAQGLQQPPNPMDLVSQYPVLVLLLHTLASLLDLLFARDGTDRSAEEDPVNEGKYPGGWPRDL